ncbi:MAG: serine/threonine protein kinase [Firmicutes bacterium]|nr:serine/threonine protein kinase [Bacillota bacterium]
MVEIRLDQLEFIGAGKHGEVYKLDEKRCVKVYRRRHYLRMELAALKRGAKASFFPQVHEWGENYIIRDYAPGIPLNHYLRAERFTPAIARQLVEMVETMRKLRFRRADTRLSHIIVDPNRKLWLIDPVNTMKPSPPYPRKLFKGLIRRGVDEEFMAYVQEHYPEVYGRWERHVRRLKERS